jgi:hypothetical protein
VRSPKPPLDWDTEPFARRAGPSPDVDRLLREAIATERRIAFVLPDGSRHVAEPHVYGVMDGVAQLLLL